MEESINLILLGGIDDIRKLGTDSVFGSIALHGDHSGRFKCRIVLCNKYSSILTSANVVLNTRKQ